MRADLAQFCLFFQEGKHLRLGLSGPAAANWHLSRFPRWRSVGFVDRIVGIETEYGCLISDQASHFNSDVWPAKVKNYVFRRAAAGTIDLHYRDYEEPPGNGGFLLNGGRL